MTWCAVALVSAWQVLTCCPILATLPRYGRKPERKEKKKQLDFKTWHTLGIAKKQGQEKDKIKTWHTRQHPAHK